MNPIQTGQLIAQCRQEKGMTQKDLAETLHVTVQAVSKWERGLNFPDIALLEPLAGVLDLTVSQLLSGSRQEREREELVTDSLRTFSGEWKRKLGRWRWLFALTAAVLVLVLVAGGCWWAKENTDWFPQYETVIAPRDNAEPLDMMENFGNLHIIRWDLTMADGLTGYTFQLEWWDENGLAYSLPVVRWDLEADQALIESGMISAQYDLYPERWEELAFFFTIDRAEEGADVECGIKFDGTSYSLRMHSPLYGSSWTWLAAPTVIPEDGAVLFCASFGDGNGRMDVGADAQLQPGPGEQFLVLRMLCK